MPEEASAFNPKHIAHHIRPYTFENSSSGSSYWQHKKPLTSVKGFFVLPALGFA